MTLLFINAKVALRTALHLGTGDSGELTDSPARRDAAGNIVIPGTSVAGALRNICTRLSQRLAAYAPEKGSIYDGGYSCNALIPNKKQSDNLPCGCPACRLFGDINPTESGGGGYKAGASKVWVYDLYPVTQCPTAFRDSVGIDRVSGAANNKAAAKFDLEIVPAGTQFLLKMKIENTEPAEEELLCAALEEWRMGRGSLGGGSARGLGAIDLLDIEVRMWDLNDPSALMSYLRDDDPWTGGTLIAGWLEKLVEEARRRVTAPPAGEECFARGFFSFEFTLQGVGPLLTGDAVSSTRFGFDHAPLFSTLFTAEGPVLPGAGLRGVLRGQAEKILRTLAAYNAGGKRDFLHTCPACDPLAREAGGPLAGCDVLLEERGIGTESEPEEGQLCLSCLLFGSPRQGSRLVVEDANILPGDMPALKAIDFLAVDRFTGGGREGAKFDALALWKPRFRVRLRLDNPEKWELGLLTLVLRDLEEGMLRVGFGASKGFGAVTAGQWDVLAGFLTEEDLPLENAGHSWGMERDYSGVYHCLRLEGENISSTGAWAEMAKEWLAALHERINTFSRKFQLSEDSYFGRPEEKLYPLEVLVNVKG